MGGLRSHDMTKDQMANAKTILWEKSKLCGICKKPLPGRYHKGTTLDHIRPTSRGGTDHISNLQLAHIKCNNWKANKLPEELKL